MRGEGGRTCRGRRGMHRSAAAGPGCAAPQARAGERRRPGRWGVGRYSLVLHQVSLGPICSTGSCFSSTCTPFMVASLGCSLIRTLKPWCLRMVNSS